MSLTPLEQSIIKTITYFDIADFPLTKEELYRFLWQPPAIGYQEFLEKLDNISCVDTKFGYYFLPGREKIIESRRERLLFSEQRLKIAISAVKKIRSVPFLRAIFVCNSVGTEQATEHSDVDFFIITEKKRIWLTRVFVVLILSLFGIRRTEKKIVKRICPSFYVSMESLDLSPWRVAEDDIHLAYWLNQMLPIYDQDNLYDKFLSANYWVKKYLPNISYQQKNITAPVARLCISDSQIGRVWKKIWQTMWQGSYGDFVNNQAKQAQLTKMKFSGKNIDRQGDKGVVINDGVLKFHENDRRAGYREEWGKRTRN